MSKPQNTVSNWFNLRTLVVLLAAFILLSPVKPSLFEGLDRALFALGINLMNPPEPEVDVAVVTLPEENYVALQEEWGRAQAVEQLLGKLLADPNRVVGVLYNQVPRQIQSPAEQLLQQAAATSEIDPELKTQIATYTRTRDSLSQYLDNPQVVRGVDVDAANTWLTANSGFAPLQTEASTSSDLVRWLPPWLQPALYQLPSSESESVVEDQSPQRLIPFVPRDSIAKHIIVESNQNFFAEFLLRLYSRRDQQQEVTWLANHAVRVESVILPLSADGSFVPYYRDAGAINSVLPLGRAMAEPPDAKMVLIGPESSPHLLQAATDLLSLDNQHYFYTASWMIWAQILVTLAILFYLVVLIPKMSPASAIFASCLFLFVFIVAQLGWQITQWQYLSLGIPIQFLLVGHVLMLLWTLQRDQRNQLHAAAHGARYQLGLQLFRDGRADDALLAIKECYTSDAVLALMYDIASQQERKRQYGEAVKTYQAILQRHGTYRDCREKVEKLIAFSSTGTGSFGADTTIAKTLIISESSINKPVLGRYEIERELGRGAMGIVYLGRDPKISRQVAIKTLSYNNIPNSELDEFKERFFREAEAAGRLNHPNIVTIYDVGEEHDLAFMAMDYVEGDSLSAHSKAEDLLPVETVYQIIIDVAEALDYAHGKNVVHRDIKPSNIMYEPQSGKVKVTDFGVARIVDSARTQTGDILGSPLYMSPEQLKAANVTKLSDIYSLGVTFYQLLTGKLPHSGENLANLTYAIIHEKHAGVRDHRPELPKSLTRIINKALHKEPDKRYNNAGDFAAAVRRALEEDFVV